jgi:hypothetical protein
MWVQAADVMTGWDAISTAAADAIPLTPMSPPLVAPGVGEAGAAAASAAGMLTAAQGAQGGAALTGADLMGTKLLAGKAVTSPASAVDKAPPPRTGAQQQSDNPAQQLQPENMASSLMQQMASMGPSLGQSAGSALQGAGPQQLLSSAPQLLSSAPQTLGQMISSFTGSTAPTTGFSPLGAAAAGGPSAALPVGFAGTGAIGGFNPAGMTSLAGGAFGSGPTRPMLPSTWGASAATTVVEPEVSAARVSPVVAGASASASGGGMMGPGAAGRRSSRAQAVTNYAEDGIDDDEDVVAEVRGYAR